jgi:hypothetical protein
LAGGRGWIWVGIIHTPLPPCPQKWTLVDCRAHCPQKWTLCCGSFTTTRGIAQIGGAAGCRRVLARAGRRGRASRCARARARGDGGSPRTRALTGRGGDQPPLRFCPLKLDWYRLDVVGWCGGSCPGFSPAGGLQASIKGKRPNFFKVRK